MIFRNGSVCATLFVLISLGMGTSVAVAQPEALETVQFTAEQVARGEREYNRSCLDCHGANLDDGEFGGPPLRGTNFREKWFDLTADALFDFASYTMPPDRPGRLSAQVYADLTAFILSHNGLEPSEVELPADSEALSELALQ